MKGAVPGLGPKKVEILSKAGFDDLSKLQDSDFYTICNLPGFGIISTYRLWEHTGHQIPYQEMIPFNESIEQPCYIENKEIKPWIQIKKNGITSLEPQDFKIEKTTVWSFPERGSWATHNPKYRGNWPPQLVRNILELYTTEGDVVLDPMIGGGTTAIECKLLGRNSISVDINPDAIRITNDRMNFQHDSNSYHKSFVGDARNLNLIENDSIDCVTIHPPYANIIHYAPLVNGDLSQFSNYSIFFKEFKKVIDEIYRVLKPGKKCAVLIGDTHNKNHYVPISTRMMIDFLKSGFVIKEDIIKREWNCESDHKLGKYANSDFLLTMHEHLFIFEKPTENLFKNSSIELLKE